MSPADAKFLAIARCLPDDLEGLRRAFRNASDDHAMLDLASMHGLLGVLADALERAKVELTPSLRKTVREQLLLQRLRHERLTQWLRAALAALDGAGVQTVSLKGPVLGERLYRDAIHRPSVDIDLLVRMDDADQAIRALVTAGWKWQDSASERYHRKHDHELHLTRANAPPLELHIRAIVSFGIRIEAEPLLARSHPFASSYGRTWVLDEIDEALFLALHAAGHYCARMSWLHDIKLATAHWGDPSWEALIGRATQLGCRRALLSVLRLTEALGANIPGRVLPAPSVADHIAEITRRRGAATTEISLRGSLVYVAHQTAASDSIVGSFRAGARIAHRRVVRTFWGPEGRRDA